jgi:hypothetical protein
MTTVVMTPTAAADLGTLMESRSLPTDTIERFKRSVAALQKFPMIGAALEGPWARYRFVLAPWRWMLVVYSYDEARDRVAMTTIQDARSSRAATGIR